jgi:hypothetical protein
MLENKPNNCFDENSTKSNGSQPNKSVLATGKITGGNRIDIFVPKQESDKKRVIAVGRIQNGVITITSEKPKAA